jgi:phage-related tail protein
MVKRRLVRGLILCLLLTSVVAAEPSTTAIIGTPPQPGWNQLNPQQKDILAPLANDWEKMDNIRRKKWLGIAEHYPAMKQDEQQRMQDRMREWADLTPGQRAKVRSAYKDFSQLPPEQKQVVKQKWEAYSNLPMEQQQRVRESGKSSRLLSSANESPNILGNVPTAETATNVKPIDAVKH